jgi:hypothetical protein
VVKKGETCLSDVLEVFEFWKELLSNGRSRLDEKRRKAIIARLRDGYSVEDLQLACLGCRASPFHNGENDRNRAYKSIELICRDADHVDHFIEVAEKEAGKLTRSASSQTAEQQVMAPSEARKRIQALLSKYKGATH